MRIYWRIYIYVNALPVLQMEWGGSSTHWIFMELDIVFDDSVHWLYSPGILIRILSDNWGHIGGFLQNILNALTSSSSGIGRIIQALNAALVWKSFQVVIISRIDENQYHCQPIVLHMKIILRQFLDICYVVLMCIKGRMCRKCRFTSDNARHLLTIKEIDYHLHDEAPLF